MNAIKHFNWKASPYDPKDHQYRQSGIAQPTRLMPSVVIGKPFNQKQESSCTANALARYHRALFNGFDTSRNFIYDCERLQEGVPLTQDEGAYGRDGVKALHKIGACSERTLPYNRATMTHVPPSAAYVEAAKYKIGGYAALHTIDDMLDCLASNQMFVFGFRVYESFESNEVARTGIVRMPQPGEKEIGGHEVIGCGFDKTTREIFFGNSYGDWGMLLRMRDSQTSFDGFGSLPFEYMQNRKLTDDIWTLYK